MFDFSIVTQWFDALLRETLGLGDFLSILIECVRDTRLGRFSVDID